MIDTPACFAGSRGDTPGEAVGETAGEAVGETAGEAVGDSAGERDAPPTGRAATVRRIVRAA